MTSWCWKTTSQDVSNHTCFSEGHLLRGNVVKNIFPPRSQPRLVLPLSRWSLLRCGESAGFKMSSAHCRLNCYHSLSNFQKPGFFSFFLLLFFLEGNCDSAYLASSGLPQGSAVVPLFFLVHILILRNTSERMRHVERFNDEYFLCLLYGFSS